MTSDAFEMLFGADPAEPEDTAAEQADDAAHAAAAAEAQEAALQAEVDRYVRLLPAIEAARPLPAQTTEQEAPVERLSGAAWIEDRLRRVLDPVSAGATVTVGVVGETVAATVIPPAGVRGRPIAEAMLAAIATAGNLGAFEVVRAGGNAFTLRRDGVGVETDAWARHGQKAARFHSDPESRAAVWDAAGLSVPSPKKGMKRQPRVHEFGEDQRGGTVELRLPDGLTIQHVQRARAALRQSLNAPQLEVTERGVHPVLSLNTKAVTRELPPTAVMRPTLFTRPRTEAERYAAREFVLPFGIRIDDETGAVVPILVPQDQVPHAAVFGGTGSGKSVLLSQMVKAAVLQGAQVLLWDAKNGKDMRNLARHHAALPGVVHYAAGSTAVLHRSILWLRHELELRQAIASELSYRGIEFRPAPVLAVLDELPAWLFDLKQNKVTAKAAEQTQAHINFIASQAREFRIFYVTAGQSAYSEGFAGMIRANTSTLVSLGEPKPINMQNLFGPDARPRAIELASTITKRDKGLGVLVDAETNRVEKLRAYFNAPGTAADEAFAAELRKAPLLRRFAYQLPRGDEPGADGSWREWDPETDPSSDSLPARWLDDEHGRPIPEAQIDDPTSPSYRPGARPLPKTHLI